MRRKLVDGDRRFGQKVAAYWNDLKEVTTDLIYTNYRDKNYFDVDMLKLSEISKAYESGFLRQVIEKVTPIALGVLGSVTAYDLLDASLDNPLTKTTKLGLSFLTGFGIFEMTKNTISSPKIMSPVYYRLSENLNSFFRKQGISKAYKLIYEVSSESDINLGNINCLDLARDMQYARDSQYLV